MPPSLGEVGSATRHSRFAAASVEIFAINQVVKAGGEPAKRGRFGGFYKPIHKLGGGTRAEACASGLVVFGWFCNQILVSGASNLKIRVLDTP